MNTILSLKTNPSAASRLGLDSLAHPSGGGCAGGVRKGVTLVELLVVLVTVLMLVLAGLVVYAVCKFVFGGA